MREIKFRFWHLADQKMIDWIWITQNAWNSYRGDTPISLLFDFLTVKKNEVITEQFTGLQDKNGVDVYEGDLISFGDVHWEDYGMPDIKEIVFDEDSASFRIYDYMELQGSSLAEKWFIDDVIDMIQVIGNIHNNPELLEYLK
jgi:uncharacterized phage protein (TIGR01671 family)